MIPPIIVYILINFITRLIYQNRTFPLCNFVVKRHRQQFHVSFKTRIGKIFQPSFHFSLPLHKFLIFNDKIKWVKWMKRIKKMQSVVAIKWYHQKKQLRILLPWTRRYVILLWNLKKHCLHQLIVYSLWKLFASVTIDKIQKKKQFFNDLAWKPEVDFFSLSVNFYPADK